MSRSTYLAASLLSNVVNQISWADLLKDAKPCPSMTPSPASSYKKIDHCICVKDHFTADHCLLVKWSSCKRYPRKTGTSVLHFTHTKLPVQKTPLCQYVNIFLSYNGDSHFDRSPQYVDLCYFLQVDRVTMSSRETVLALFSLPTLSRQTHPAFQRILRPCQCSWRHECFQQEVPKPGLPALWWSPELSPVHSRWT